MRLVLLSSFVGPVCMGEGHPRLLVVGPLAVFPPPLGPFVTGASMLLMICSEASRAEGKGRGRGEERNHRQKGQGGRRREMAFISKSFATVFSNLEHLVCSKACETKWLFSELILLKSMIIVALIQINSLGAKGFYRPVFRS